MSACFGSKVKVGLNLTDLSAQPPTLQPFNLNLFNKEFLNSGVGRSQAMKVPLPLPLNLSKYCGYLACKPSNLLKR